MSYETHPPERTMAITTPPGAKVVMAYPKNGYSFDQHGLLKLGIKKGDVFTVSHIEINRSSSTLFLVEFPDIQFNTVNFRNL